MSAKPSPRSSRLQEAETGLQALGFSEYEARIYLALLKTNPATASRLIETARAIGRAARSETEAAKPGEA